MLIDLFARSKFFMASTELFPVQDAVEFPAVATMSLTGQAVEFPGRLKERVTLVGVFHRQFGYSMLPTWLEPFEEAFGVSGVSGVPEWGGEVTRLMMGVT